MHYSPCGLVGHKLKLTHSILAVVYPSVKYGLSFPTVSWVVSQPPLPEMGFKVQLTPAWFDQVKEFVAAFHVISTRSQAGSLFLGAIDRSILYQPMMPGTRFSSLFWTPLKDEGIEDHSEDDTSEVEVEKEDKNEDMPSLKDEDIPGRATSCQLLSLLINMSRSPPLAKPELIVAHIMNAETRWRFIFWLGTREGLTLFFRILKMREIKELSNLRRWRTL